MRTPKQPVFCRMPRQCCMGFASCVSLSMEGECPGSASSEHVGQWPEAEAASRTGPLWDTQGQKQCWRSPLLTLSPANCNDLPAPSLVLVSHLSELQTLAPLLIIPHRLLSLIILSVQSQGLQEVFYYQLKSTLN